MSAALPNAAPENSADGTVATLAGSGIPGLRDGPATESQFLQPFGMAYDSSSKVLAVSDSAANRIREIAADGTVQTIAGSGALFGLGFLVSGGYKDGPAASAQFNRPMGIAFGKDGAIYIADSANHCIRRLQDGVVTTFAGDPQRKDAANGPVASAAFRDPMGIAFDKQGDAYVADFGAGIRRIHDAKVTTLPGTEGATVTSVSVYEDAQDLTVVASDPARPGLLVYHRSRNAVSVYGTSAEGLHNIGQPLAVAAVDHHEFVFADAANSRVAVFREPIETFETYSYAGLVAGQLLYGEARGGYVNGPLGAAAFSAPTGVEVLPGGAIAIADGGNHLVRVIRNVNLRHPLAANLARYSTDRNLYRIVLIGNSYTFWDAMWDRSIPGTIERILNADRTKLGLRKPVLVECVRIDGGPVSDIGEFISDVLSQGLADGVVWQFNLAEVAEEGAHHPGRHDYDKWPLWMRDAVVSAAAHGAWTLVAEQPQAWEISPTYLGNHAWLTPQFPYENDFLAYGDAIQKIGASGVPAFDLRPYFAANEHAGVHAAYFVSADHPSWQGNVFIGTLIAHELEKRRPWLKASSH